MSLCRKLLSAFLLLASLSCGCTREETVTPINTSKPEHPTAPDSARPDKLHIALGGMVTPEEGLIYYREFLDYIGARLGRPIQFVDAEDYAEINKKLEARELDAAFVCSGPYVDGKRKFGLELIAAPQAYGKPVYYSYIIVPRGSTAKNLEDLRGKVFAFADPLSNTGKMVPEYMLARQGTTSDRFFGKTHYSGSHDKSIAAVSEGLVDGAAVDSLIWDYLSRKRPEKTLKTRILLKSPPYAPPPFVVHPALDPTLKSRLREIVLNAHTTPEGKKILDKMMIDRFVALEDKEYDSVREIKTWVEKRKPGPRI